jgi:hypothetical protein
MRNIFLILTFVLTSSAFAGDYVIVVNPANGDTNAKDAFLLNTENWSDGTPVEPYELDKSGGLKNVLVNKSFYKTVLGMGTGEYNGHWDTRKAGGKTKAPTKVKDFSAMKRFISKKKGAIGYLPKSEADGSVKVIGNFSG